MEPRHESIEHTADTGFRAHAPSVEKLFEECAAALFGLMYVPSGEAIRTLEMVSRGDDLPDLLVAWLSDLLWLAESEHLALVRFEVDVVTGHEVRGRVGGTSVDLVELHGPPVKAVTYHGLEVDHDDGWRATVILDV